MAASPQMSPQQQNAINRQLVLMNAINEWLQITTNTYTSGPSTIINVPLRNVGLVKRIVVEISGTLNIGGTETQTQTRIGLANLLSNIQLTDLSNQTRINTSGWHLHFLASAKRQFAHGAAFLNDSPVNIGSNFPVITAPASYVANGATFRMFYEIPVCYGDMDLRGAIYANVVNATFNLQLTINPNMFVASTADPTLAVYRSSSATLGSMPSFTVTVYQNILDQLPIVQNRVVLPALDLGTAYLLNNTQVTSLVANQDNPIPYANFRDFMSTFVIYDNFGFAGVNGADTGYWALQSANYTNIFKMDPFMASLLNRWIISDDFPAGNGMSTYYFDHRVRPISTIQFGNMALVHNPANVQGANSVDFVGYESLAFINQITQAGSLYGN